MNFSELESLMSSRGVTTLAEMARTLNTTPQAVSNWKARNQVPHHIVSKINQSSPPIADSPQSSAQSPIYASPSIYEEDTISLSDLLLTMAENFKIIVLTTFISIFFTFTYVKIIKQPLYLSKATILLPEEKGGTFGGLAGLATQFGVNIPMGAQADLSSPSLLPDIIKSRSFSENILNKKFYTDKIGREKTLLEILANEDGSKYKNRNTLVITSMGKLGKILKLEKKVNSPFSVISVTTTEPLFSKNLADSALIELEALNQYYKSKKINKKINFIKNRIKSVENELKVSELNLKVFNEKNRQISSPALLLEQERISRGLEIQKGIFLTLQQQLELAKIEEIQESSVIQILDKPQIPVDSFNINTKASVLLSSVIGLILGVLIGFARNFINNDDMGERKKLRRVKFLLKSKSKDLFEDHRISGIISGIMFAGLPLFLGYESKNPVFFGKYSLTFLLINIVYVSAFLFSLGLFVLTMRRKSVNKKG
jgi:uncharacterized protein involved in exopolysaccharide biosynthesis